MLPASAGAVLETPAYDMFHAESDIVQKTDANLKPSQCPELPKEGQALDLMKTINIVLCNNRDTRASWFQLRSQAIGLNQTKVDAYIPSVTSDVSLSRSNSYSDGNTNVSSATGADISLGYTLFDFGVTRASIDAAEKSMQAAMLSYDSSLQGVIASTIGAYYDVLSADYNLQAAKQSLDFSSESYSAAQVRYEIGLVAMSDVLQAKASYSQAQLSVERAENALKLAQNDLLILMGYAPDHPLLIEDVDDSQLMSESLDVRVQDLVDKAKLNRKDLAASVKSLEASRASLEATKRGNLPKVNLSASQSYDADKFFENTQRTGRVGFSVSVPIFSGFTRAYSIKSSELDIKAQELSLEQKNMDIVQDVWTAYTNYKSAEQSWMTSFDAMNVATELNDIALGRYKAGVGDLLDVLSAQNSYTSALNSQIDARFALLTARINLVRAVGVLDLTNADPKTSIAGLQ
jgi:TolC family type I secretion outer membrane protein